MSDLTLLLEATARGEPKAEEQLLALVYAELHRMANQKLSVEGGHPTLQPTVLVHDVWLRLLGGGSKAGFANRAHFFGAAAQAMRRILIERARRHNALKRGGGLERVDLDSIDVAASADSTALLRIDEALEKLAHEDPASAEVGQQPPSAGAAGRQSY